MAPFLGILLTICGLTESQGITTKSEVSVEVGATVSIPCLYDQKYKSNAKALCKGYYWNTCLYVVTTRSASSSSTVLYGISDDTDQRVFTVTITSTEEGEQSYWCSVVKSGIKGTYFKLSVVNKPSSSELYVDSQEITGIEGDSLSIHCHYKKQNAKQIGWCKLSNCDEKQKKNIDGSLVTIDASKNDVFVVTMRDLHIKSSGWYICFQEELYMPVHLTIALKPTTLPPSTSTHSVGTLSEDVSDENNQGKEDELVQFNDLYYLFITLGILLFIILVAMLIWWMFHRQDKMKRATIMPTGSSESGVVYSIVALAHSNTARNMARDDINPRQNLDIDETVEYSNIVFKPRK